MDDVALSLGWYGKSPSTGDFISRRLSKSVVDKLDLWLQAGMTAIREQAPDAWERHYGAAPVWNALLPVGIVSSDAVLVVVAASVDRVGRRFPFCVVFALPAEEASLARITSLAEFSASVAQVVKQSIRTSVSGDDLDQRLPVLMSRFIRDDTSQCHDLSEIAAVLGDAVLGDDLSTVPLNAQAAFPWPDLPRTFDPTGATSYWWSSGQPGQLRSGFTHSGQLDAKLFLTLFGGASNEVESRAPPD